MMLNFIKPVFNKGYFSFALLLLLTEVWIATSVHDSIIRPYGGDFLVVILLYCLVKSFLHASVLPTAAMVLLFAYAVEISQHFHFIKLLGLQNSKLAAALLGTSFSYTDLALYTFGILCVIAVEKVRIHLQNG